MFCPIIVFFFTHQSSFLPFVSPKRPFCPHAFAKHPSLVLTHLFHWFCSLHWQEEYCTQCLLPFSYANFSVVFHSLFLSFFFYWLRNNKSITCWSLLPLLIVSTAAVQFVGALMDHFNSGLFLQKYDSVKSCAILFSLIQSIFHTDKTHLFCKDIVKFYEVIWCSCKD